MFFLSWMCFVMCDLNFIYTWGVSVIQGAMRELWKCNPVNLRRFFPSTSEPFNQEYPVGVLHWEH